MSKHMRNASLAAALSLSVCLAATASATTPAATIAGIGPSACSDARWQAETIASGFGLLENLGFDGRGGLLLSEQDIVGPNGRLVRLLPDGSRSTAVPGVFAPAGIVLSGSTVYFATGNSIVSGPLGIPDGTIEALDLDTGAVSVVARGLNAPNGLARLPNGDFVVSRSLGEPSSLTLVAPGTSTNIVYAPSVRSSNGLAYDPSREKLFVSSSFTPVTIISAIDIDAADALPATTVVPGIGPLNGADDLTVGPDRQVYAALNAAGKIVRVDPESGQTCLIAEGLPFTSSVRFGFGPGWDSNALYATSFLGTVTKLTRIWP